MGSRVLVKLRYSDGTEKIGVFETQEAADRFIHNEGDHLLEATYLDDNTFNYT